MRLIDSEVKKWTFARRLSRRARRALAAAVLALGAGAVMVSCNSSSAKLALAKGCSINSDCDSPLVCAFQTCHQQCTTSRDCTGSELCVTAVRPLAVCQLPSEVSCSYNSQCVDGELCAIDGHCRDQCAADRDCVAGQVCASGSCANPAEVSADGTLARASMDGGTGTPCQLNSDCGDSGLVCRQGYCGLQCKADIDCVAPEGPGGTCVANVCVLDAGGGGGTSGAGGTSGVSRAGSSGTETLPTGYGLSCNLQSDCTLPLKCGNSGQCVYECNVGADCVAVGACCVAHQCATGAACDQTTGGSGGEAGAASSTCKACVSNSTCDDGLYCNGQEQCYAGCCAPALDTPCDSHSACIIDSCDEKTQKCSSKVVAAEDVDGDGHLAFGCTGGDDCDDNDPTVYTGHPEAFDGKDNDCNGYVDDWMAEPKGPTSGALMAGAAPGSVGVAIGGGAGAWQVSGIVNGTANWDVAPADPQWKSGDVVGNPLPLSTYYFATVDAASGPSSSCVLTIGNGNYQAIVLDATGALLTEVGLGAASRAVQYSEVIWTGAGYLAGWDAAGYTGYYALLDPVGNLLGSHSVPANSIVDNDQVSVGANGTSLAVAYQVTTGNYTIELSVLNLAGGVTGTVAISTDMEDTVRLQGLAGVPNGYVVLWSHDGETVATFVPALNGMPGTPKTVIADPLRVPTFARGITDGVGAAFAIQYSDGVSFGYLHGSMKNPFELSSIAPGATLNNIAGGAGGRLGVFYTQNGGMYGRQAGYAGLASADCSKDSDCASGICKAIVASGPKAHSACQ